MNRDQYQQKKNWLRARFDIDHAMPTRHERRAEDRHPRATGGQANGEACLLPEEARPSRLAAEDDAARRED